MTSNCIIDAIPTEGGIVERIKVYQNENGVSLEVKYTNGLNDHYCNFGKGKDK